MIKLWSIESFDHSVISFMVSPYQYTLKYDRVAMSGDCLDEEASDATLVKMMDRKKRWINLFFFQLSAHIRHDTPIHPAFKGLHGSRF